MLLIFLVCYFYYFVCSKRLKICFAGPNKIIPSLHVFVNCNLHASFNCKLNVYKKLLYAPIHLLFSVSFLLFKYICCYKVNAHFDKLFCILCVITGPAVYFYIIFMQKLNIFFCKGFISKINVQIVIFQFLY